MSPNDREREYAKRRYEKWQSKQSERNAARARVRRNALFAVAGVAVVAALVGGTLYFTSGDDDAPVTAAPELGASDEPTADATASAEPTASAGSTSSASASAETRPSARSNPCAIPSSTAVSSPKSYPSPPNASLAQGKTWNLAIETTCGPIAITLDGAKAPKAVASTLFLARNGFWDGSPCHRLVTAGIFVLQCGDPTGSGQGGPGYTYGPVENAPAGDVYPAGTVAMARVGGDGNSLGSQFFLVYKDSTIPSDSAGGYTVIGKIVGGLDVVEKVAAGGVEDGSQDGAPSRKISLTSTTVS